MSMLFKIIITKTSVFLMGNLILCVFCIQAEKIYSHVITINIFIFTDSIVC